MGQIVLIRHGRSAHVVTGLLDRAAFLQWRQDYELAGLDPADAPPGALPSIAQTAGIIVSSDTPRALESARLLARDREIISSPLLRELTLDPPNIGILRLPMLGWALAYGAQWLLRHTLRRPHATPAEHHRATITAQWLIDLSAQHGLVIATTHHALRTLVAAELTRRGWTATRPPRRRSAHWSAWTFTCDGICS